MDISKQRQADQALRWEEHKVTIRVAFLQEGRTLEEVRKKLAVCGFYAK